MAFQIVNRLPDRYFAFFVNGQRKQKVLITGMDFDRNDRDKYIQQMYSPGPGWVVTGYAPYVDTYDTPSQNLEPGTMWEGLRLRTDPLTKQRRAIPLVMWKEANGHMYEGKADEIEVKRNGNVVENIVRKSR